LNNSDLCFTSALDLGRLYRARELSPVEVAEAVLARIAACNPILNAYLTVTGDAALEQARAAEARLLKNEPLGALDGVPYSLKDLEPTAGIRTTFGSKWFEDYVPEQDGILAGRLKKTGAVLLGKTNTSHFGYKDMCDNMLGPPCSNPWKLDRTSGASSGGAGAASAAGLGPLAHGSDGAGSIRIPASLCGVFGLKPNFGRIPHGPSDDAFASRSHNGPITRTVRDAALFMEAMAGMDLRDPFSMGDPVDDWLSCCDGDLAGLRVAWSADLGYAPVDPEVRRLTEAAARLFEDFGCSLADQDPGWPDPRDFHKVIYEVGVASRQIKRVEERPEWIEATLMQAVDNAKSVSALEHGAALLARTQLLFAAQRFFEKFDLLLTPQMPVAAWSKEPGPEEGPRQIDGKATPTMFDRLPFTYPFNLTGQPAASVPCGFTSEGLPVGIQIVGRWRDEATVLRAAACFEAAQPWVGLRPPQPE
jgi:Asp-tRNA(Asn)/Glu-tRNA(Gln) amidotransferase A subunit family amidase